MPRASYQYGTSPRKYYADDEYTDQTMRQIAEETIREKALKLLEDEVLKK